MEKLGEEFGGALSFLYTELRACIGYAYEGRAEDITIFGELFVEVYGIFAAAQDEVVDKKRSDADYLLFFTMITVKQWWNVIF